MRCVRFSMALTQFAVLRDSLQTTRFSTLASFMVLLYDQVLTFEDEVTFVWRFPWSFGKILFLWNRYACIVSLGFMTGVIFQGQLPSSFCSGALHARPALRTLQHVSVEVLLSGHIYAMYDRNKKVLVFVILLFIMDKVAQFVFVYDASLLSHHKGKHPAQLGQILGCFSYQESDVSPVGLISVPLFVYVLCLTMLTLYKAWVIYRRGDRYPLLMVILRDSIYYYVSFLLVAILNVYFRVFSTNGTTEFANGWIWAIPVTMASRLFLDARKRCYRNESIALTRVSSIVFSASQPGLEA